MKQGLFKTLGLCKETFSGNFTRIFFIFLLALFTVTPRLYIAKYLMGLWMVFFLFTFGVFNSTRKQIRQFGILGAVFVLLCIIYRLLGISSASLAYCMARTFVFFAPIIALAIISKCDSESKIRFLFHFISLVIAINVADSIRIVHEVGLENIVYQNLAEEMGEEGVVNLGGNLFVNMIVFYSSVMFFSFLKAEHMHEKLIFLLYFGISAYFIIVCSLKASALVLLLLAIILLYIANRSKNNFGKVILISLIIAALLFVFRDTIINALISLIGSDRIAYRLEIFTSVSSLDESTTLTSREDLWMVSINSWLKNPITFLFGIGDHNWVDWGSEVASGVGNHSDLLDVLARYGLFGAVVFYLSIILYYKYLQKYFGYLFKWEILSFFILVFLMALTKRIISGESAIILFILFPLSLIYFSKEKKTVIP